jgi:CheY-like chemotaxis protein
LPGYPPLDGRRATASARPSLAWFLPAERWLVPKILIVENSPDNMKLFRALLTLRGYEVVGLSGGDGMLEAIAREQPALVLMDIQLPGKDGFALLSEIRGSPHAQLRLLALTAHAGDRERALAAGFDGYITLPIDIRSFPAQVQQAVAGSPTA